MAPADAASTSSPPPRAGLLGALTSFPAGLAIGLIYYLRHHGDPHLAQGWSWEAWALAVALATPIIGGFWAAGASWGIRWGARRRVKLLRTPAVAGFLGGTLGGLVPMTICVGGFGALHAPYVGTALVGFSLLLSFSSFALLHPFAPEDDEPAPTWRARALASVLVIVPFGLAIMALISTVFPWSVIVVIRDQLVAQFDSVTLLVSVGVVLSAPFLGGTLGFLLGLVTSLSRILARAWASWRPPACA